MSERVDNALEFLVVIGLIVYGLAEWAWRAIK